jgi:hypothetical protein
LKEDRLGTQIAAVTIVLGDGASSGLSSVFRLRKRGGHQDNKYILRDNGIDDERDCNARTCRQIHCISNTLKLGNIVKIYYLPYFVDNVLIKNTPLLIHAPYWITS